MKPGLLWFDDNTERSVIEKIVRGAEHYEKKFGEYPNIVYINPLQRVRNGGPIEVDRITVRETNMVLTHHFWYGFQK